MTEPSMNPDSDALEREAASQRTQRALATSFVLVSMLVGLVMPGTVAGLFYAADFSPESVFAVGISTALLSLFVLGVGVVHLLRLVLGAAPIADKPRDAAVHFALGVGPSLALAGCLALLIGFVALTGAMGADVVMSASPVLFGGYLWVVAVASVLVMPLAVNRRGGLRGLPLALDIATTAPLQLFLTALAWQAFRIVEGPFLPLIGLGVVAAAAAPIRWALRRWIRAPLWSADWDVFAHRARWGGGVYAQQAFAAVFGDLPDHAGTLERTPPLNRLMGGPLLKVARCAHMIDQGQLGPARAALTALWRSSPDRMTQALRVELELRDGNAGVAHAWALLTSHDAYRILGPSTPHLHALQAWALAVDGQTRAARRLLDDVRLDDLSPWHRALIGYPTGCALLALGDPRGEAVLAEVSAIPGRFGRLAREQRARTSGASTPRTSQLVS